MPEATEETELLTVPEAAGLLRLQPSTIRSWILNRRLPFVKLGRVVRIRKADCDSLVTESTVPATGKRLAA